MSFNRNKDEDRYNTRQMVNKEPDNFSEKSWLDHSGAAAKIDVMLLKGASSSDLENSGRKDTYKQHLYHLKKAHGLSIDKNDDGIRIFSVCRDAETGNRSKEEVGQFEKVKTQDGKEIPGSFYIPSNVFSPARSMWMNPPICSVPRCWTGLM